ncbi:MAG: DinB family protein [Chloroflexi bacterium]|nr:MAG: DinB family protein [Chloroflexota bacterium]
MASTLRINFVTGGARRYVPLIQELARIPDRIDVAMTATSVAAGGEGDWTPSRVVGHLVAYARQSHENLRRMAWMTDPLIKSVDDAAQAEQHQWDQQTRARLLGWLTEAVAESVDLLAELPDSSWGRPGQHPASGRRSIRQQVQGMIDHFEEHIAQLESMRR